MNPKILWFALGLLTGGTIGSVSMGVYLKKKFTREFEEAIDEMEEYYDKVDEYRRPFKDEEEDPVNPVKNDQADNGRDKGPLSKEEREEIKAKLNRNWEATTNYASMYSSDEEAGTGGEPDDDEEDPSLSEEESDGPVVDVEATEEHSKSRKKKPKIISASSLGDYPAYYERDTFFYYADLGVLTDESNEEIPDPETYLGDCLTKYGFDQNDEDRIFVINYRLSTIFEVQKTYGDLINNV